jgi:hypothetical protein
VSVESRRHLWNLDQEYAARAAETRETYREAARTEAAHKKARAKAALRFKESGERMSVAEAELRAEADDALGALYEARLVAAADKESLADVLRSLRQRCANGQTFIADEREVDHGHGRNGA